MTKRGGRKRKQGKREPNGKPQRPSADRIERDVMASVIAYRSGILGIAAADLKDQKGATLLGRMCLTGTISDAQWQAGEDWLALVNARYAAANAPRGFRTAGNVALALDEEAEERRYQAIKERFDAANDAVEDRLPVLERIARMKALSLIVVQELDQPKLYGALFAALNALAGYFSRQSVRA